jgi:hypothetical protein
MANKRYDICTPRKGRDDKTFWTRIGVAWEGDKGIQLVFEALPLPDAEGRCVANLFEPRENNNRGGGQQQSDGQRDDLNDDIPF